MEGHKAAEILMETGVRRIHPHTNTENYANNFRRLMDLANLHFIILKTDHL